MTEQAIPLKRERYELTVPVGPFEAAQVSAENVHQVAMWAGGSVNYRDQTQAIVEVYAWREGVNVQSWQLQAGDWVVLDVGAGRFEVWPDAKFREKFRRAG